MSSSKQLLTHMKYFLLYCILTPYKGEEAVLLLYLNYNHANASRRFFEHNFYNIAH